MKVYLSKSHRSRAEVAIDIRNELRKAGFEVLEHDGGVWCPENINKSDAVIFVTNDAEVTDYDYAYWLGKGQRAEYDAACDGRKEMYVWDYENGLLREVYEVMLDDPNNYIKHSIMEMDDDDGWELHELLSEWKANLFEKMQSEFHGTSREGLSPAESKFIDVMMSKRGSKYTSSAPVKPGSFLDSNDVL